MLLGAAAGPHGAGLLTPAALGGLEAAAWVALAVIGVFLGLGLPSVARREDRSALADSALVAAITISTIAGGLVLLFFAGAGSDPPDSATPAVLLLISACMSVSAALHPASTAGAGLRRAARLADLDDLPLLAVGVTLVAILAGNGELFRLVLTTATGAAVGLAGWLLFERATVSERGVFVTGAVLLLAGVGAYLGTSPLLSGCVAALVWVRARGPADRITAEDLSFLQHPLIALLLIVAGGLTEWTPGVLWTAGGLIVLRLAAKLLASVIVARRTRISPALLATVLLQPGILGIALALNARAVLGPDHGWILSAVTIATVASEMLAAFLPRDYESPD